MIFGHWKVKVIQSQFTVFLWDLEIRVAFGEHLAGDAGVGMERLIVKRVDFIYQPIQIPLC